MIGFIGKYWTYIVAFGTVLAFLFEKGRTIWLEKKVQKTSYNRLLTAVLKLYFSYTKHRELYSESPMFNFPDLLYIPMLKHLDTFNNDIAEFKKTIEKEADIIPEIIIQTHMLFDAIDRIRIIDRIKATNTQNHVQISDEENVRIKRAQFYAMEETYESFFDEIVHDIQKKTSTSIDFIDRMNYYKTEEHKKEVQDDQTKILKRYYDSLHRQGAIPTELYEIILREFGLD